MNKNTVILQLLTKNKDFMAAGYGVLTYVTHMKKALIDAGYIVKEYTIENDLTKLKSMEQDIVFFHSMPFVDNPLRNKIYETIAQMKGKKVLFLNDHALQSIEKRYGDVFSNKAILNIFDKIVTFNNNTPAYTAVKHTLGEQEALKKYIHMRHPYKFVSNPSKVWVPVKLKKHIITNLGRYAPFKDSLRILRGRYPFINKGFDIEFRGIKDDDQIKGQENFKYEFNWKGKPIGYSNVVEHIDNLFINKYDVTPDDDLMDFEREGKIFWFEQYDVNKISKTIGKAAYGTEFFNLPNQSWAGNNFEYAQMEIIDSGTIGIFDYGQTTLTKLYDKDNKLTSSLIEQDACICLSSKFENLENTADKCQYILNNQDVYEQYRIKAYELMKIHADPVNIANELIEEIYK